MPLVPKNTKVRAIPTRLRQRYFRKIYERYDVLDTAKIVKPEGMVRIYDAMQLLAQKHGGERWSENPFARYWHFRLERVLFNGEKRYRVKQIFIVNEPDCFDYQDEWTLRCQPDSSPRTKAIREAAAAFKKARQELMAALKDGSVQLLGKAQYKRYSVDDFADGVVNEHWFKILETGTLPSEALRDRADHDSDAEGDLIYLYVTEASLNAHLNGSALPTTQRPVPINPPPIPLEDVASGDQAPTLPPSPPAPLETVASFDPAPSLPPYRRRKQGAVKMAIAACYPGGNIPYIKRDAILVVVNQWLSANGHDTVGGDTLDRAIGRRPQPK